jgi:hypothetical protein
LARRPRGDGRSGDGGENDGLHGAGEALRLASFFAGAAATSSTTTSSPTTPRPSRFGPGTSFSSRISLFRSRTSKF